MHEHHKTVTQDENSGSLAVQGGWTSGQKAAIRTETKTPGSAQMRGSLTSSREAFNLHVRIGNEGLERAR